MMRRYNSPYNGKQYLLNDNTNELHDLDNEQTLCQINNIKHEHIVMFDSLSDAMAYQKKYFGKSNGCYWCLTQYNNG